VAKVDAWIAKGAQPSERVKALVKKARKEAEQSA
jgi:small subunit ribosomal protein S16